MSIDNPNPQPGSTPQESAPAQPTAQQQLSDKAPTGTQDNSATLSNPTAAQTPATQTPAVSPVHKSAWKSIGDVLSGIPRSRPYVDRGTGQSVDIHEGQSYKDSATGQVIPGPKSAKASDILLAIAGHALMGSFAGAQEKGPGAPLRAFGKGGMATVSQNEQQDQQAKAQANQDYTRSLTAFETNMRNLQTSMALARTDKEMHDAVAEGNKSILDNIEDQFKFNNGEEVSEHDAQDITKFPPQEWIRYATRTVPSLDDQGKPLYVDMHGHLTTQDAPGAHQKFESVYQLVHKNAIGDIRDADGNVASWLQKAVTDYDGLIPGASKSLLQGNGATGQISAQTASKIHDSYVSLNLLQHDLDQFANTVNSGKEKADQMPPVDLKAALRSGAISITDAQNFKKAAAGSGHPDEILAALRTQHPDSANRITALFNADKDYLTQYTQDRVNKQQQQAAANKQIGENSTPEGQAKLQHEQLENKKLQNEISAGDAQGQGLAVPKGFTPNPDASSMNTADLQKDLKTKGVNIPANFETLYGIGHNAADLKTLPSNPRKGSNQMSQQEGLAFIRKYINPQYQEGDYPAASSLSKELASTRQGTAGGALLSAGVASNHLDLLEQASAALENHDVQKLNRLANTLGVQLGDSPAVTFQAIAEQVNGEVGKVVAGGSPHEAELENLRKNLNSDQSPQQVRNVIKSYIGLMAGRVNEINDRSQQYFGRDVKGISPSVIRVFNKYGFAVGSQVQVVDPTGKVRIFPDKKSADQFKKVAGIQ